jgi:hypothetical protein
VVLFHEAIANRLGLTAADNKALGIIAREARSPPARSHSAPA